MPTLKLGKVTLKIGFWWCQWTSDIKNWLLMMSVDRKVLNIFHIK